MAFYREIAAAFRSQVAKDRIAVALLRIAQSMRSEILPADPPPTPKDVETHNRRQALAKRILDQPYQTVDVMFPRLMANQQAQDRANDLASSSLSGAVETALDTQLQTFVEGFIDDYV